MGTTKHVVMFSEARIAMELEVRKHPPLMGALAVAGIQPDDFEGKLAEIAAYCKVLVDGMYTPSELDKLCDILFTKLRAKRGGIIV